jgi:hypothetical protein
MSRNKRMGVTLCRLLSGVSSIKQAEFTLNVHRQLTFILSK